MSPGTEKLVRAGAPRALEKAVRDRYSKMLVSVTLCSEPLYSVSLCIVHGYARVHTSIYIYIYTSVDPCIYMHGARRAEQRGAEHSVAEPSFFKLRS